MKKKILLIAFIVFVSVFSGFSADRVKLSSKAREQIYKNLSQRYRNWYEMVYYISTEDEQNVFLLLTNDRDRDIFIQAFWQQRDPTAGTEENEYKKEIQERFDYVGKYYSREATRPGWKTDMGKFHMLLGKPVSIERFDSKAGLYPAQVWYYAGAEFPGFPAHFNITFYKPGNTTEWKFYNPALDGPGALLIKQYGMDETDYETLYGKIRELAPTLAMPAITMIPNDVAPGYQPTLRNNILISNIYEAPKRNINASYATHFLNYKGYVNVESSINYVDSTYLTSITKYDPFDLSFVNFSIKPKRISLGFNDDKGQYFFNFDMSVSLKKGDDFVYEYKKNFDFYVEPSRVNQLKGNGIVLHDSFPAVPGKYKLSVFIMNSVGKEFSYFERDIVVPELSQNTYLSAPILAYKVEAQQDASFFTYRFDNKKLYVDTDRNIRLRETPQVMVGVYNLTEGLWKAGKLEIVLRSMNELKKYSKTYTVQFTLFPYRKDMNIFQVLGAEEGGLNPDYYELEIFLRDRSNQILDKQRLDLAVAPTRDIAYPMESFKKSRADNPFFHYYTLATQYEKIGNLANAEKNFARCIENNPDFKEGLVAYLGTLNKAKKYTQVLVEVEKLKSETRFEFDYYLLRATALYGMKDYKEALNALLKANTIYNSDIRVLNLLGFTLLNLNDYQEALKALEASLSLDNNQSVVSSTIEKIKKQVNTNNK